MTALPPDLEALMPEPFGYVPFAGEFYPPDELDAEVKNDPTVPAVYTAAQMREAILAATERAAKVRQVAVPDAADEAFRLRKLTGQLVAPVGRGYAEGWKAGYEAAKERAATLCEQRAVNAPFMEGHLSAMECAAAIRGASGQEGGGAI